VPSSAAEQKVREAFAEQAEWCRTLASPLTATICDLLAQREWPESAATEQLRNWPGDPRASADAVPLRTCGGLHALVRAGKLPELAAYYPPNEVERPGDSMWPAIAGALAHPDLLPWLEGPPQTNEVGRSAALVAGLLVFAARYRLPISLLELGASAGLNLQLDRFGFDLGGLHIGDVHSGLQLTPEWQGPRPPEATLCIAERAGVDLHPLDPMDDSERLLAYVWADQVQRSRQLEAALTIAKAHPLGIDQGDAAIWLEERLARPSPAGRGRVIMHSIAFQYFPLTTQAKVRAAIEHAGASATEDQPVGWLRFERDGPDRDAYLRLHSWPGDTEQLLARSHPHGASISWLALPGN
jgi:hypothetical protein